ncbi:hypothetical protein [Spiroplasma endosymbiont of Zeiraphera isertana]|uniref:hypothetical protein n=1 Tax=Spiroplasma endosymbiont of Zeiraphera isertana TaxID=3066313 RepID=UPI00313B4A4F
MHQVYWSIAFLKWEIPLHILHSAIKTLELSYLNNISVFPETLKVSPVAVPLKWLLITNNILLRKSSSWFFW